MFGMTKKQIHGIELIEEVTSRFTTMIDELEEGVADCRAEKENVKTQIDELRKRDTGLIVSIERAETITTNLRILLGE